MDAKTTDTRLRIAFILIVIIGSVCLLEAMSFVAIRLIANTQPWIIWEQKKWVPEIPPQEYLDKRHPYLGWPSIPRLQSEEFDSEGSRRNTFFDETQQPCVSAYGDSFTWSTEVSYEHAWPNRLSALLGCRVTNFGIGGYGVDQAVLRHEKNFGDRASISILTIVPYNAYRNLNQLRSLLTGGADPYSLKPRYVLHQDGLKLIPLPALKAQELIELSVQPGKFLSHEFFLPGSDYGPIAVGFPYSVFWWELLTNKAFIARVKSRITKQPHWWYFYRPGHSSSSFELLAALANEFARNAMQRSQKHLVAFLPDNRSVDYYLKTGLWEYQPLIDTLRERDIRVVNLGDRYMERLGSRTFCSMLMRPDDCNGHFNVEGYFLLAEVVRDVLKEIETFSLADQALHASGL